MKQRLIFLIIFLAAVLIIGPFLIPLPKQPDLAPEVISGEGAWEGGRFISVNGYQSYVKDTGPRDGEVVLLLHGFGGSTFSWRETIPVLTNNGYRVVALDLKGFGLSEKSFGEDYSHSSQAVFVAGVLDALDIQQAAIVGHSMGANVLAHFALAYPERVTLLVIVDGAVVTAEGEQPGFAGGGWLVRVPQVRRLSRIFARLALSEEEIAEILESAVSDPKSVTPEMVEGYFAPLTIQDWELALLGIVRDAAENELERPLENITAPTLIIWGEDDSWVELENGERLLEALPNAELVIIPGAGHLPMEERPEDFNTLLLDFLGKGAVRQGG